MVWGLHWVAFMWGCAYGDYEIFHQRYSADPAPMEHEGRLWMYTSHDNAKPGYTMTDYNAFSSEDLVNWRDEGIVFSVDSIDWADYAWAQQVIKLENGTFAMYYAAWCSGKDPKCQVPGVGVAYSAGPGGPFVDVLGETIMPGNDPGVFVDPDDASVRVLCSNVRPDQSPGNYGPLCGRLAEDMVTWLAPPRVVAGFNLTTWRFFEAPWISKIGGRYYMSYMMHGTDLGYAMSDDVLANYTPMGALQWTPPYDCDDVATANNSQGYGPNNHQGLVEFPRGSGAYYLAYHTRKLQQDRNLSVRARNVALDRLYANATDGSLLPVTSTPDWLQPVKFLDPFALTPAVTMASCSDGVGTASRGDVPGPRPPPGRLSLVNLTRGSFARLRFVDFADGAAGVAFTATSAAGATLDVELGVDATASAVRRVEWRSAGSCDVPAAAGVWQTVHCDLKGPNDLKGVVPELRFFVASGDLEVDSWKFFEASTREASRRHRAPTSPPPQQGAAVAVAVAAVGARSKYLVCDRAGTLAASGAAPDAPGARLRVVDNADGSYRLECDVDALAFAACADGEAVALEPDLDANRLCGKWRLQGIANGPFYAFQSWLTKKWLVADDDGTLAVKADSYMLGPKGNERNVVDPNAHFQLRELAAL